MIPTQEVLILGAALFGIGLVGVILRRNVLIALMSIELMLNGVNLTMIGAARARQDVLGQGFSFMVIALAAAEAAVGLAIVVAVFRSRRTVNIDHLTLMKR